MISGIIKVKVSVISQSQRLRLITLTKTLIKTKSNITTEFMFAGIKMFWARLKLILKMNLRRAQNIFMPKNINSITINTTLEGIQKIKT